MKRTTLTLVGLVALSVGSATCGTEFPLDSANGPTASTIHVTTNADLTNVHASQSLALMIDATNLILVAPDDTPPPGQETAAVYLEFHLDDETSPPLLVTAATRVSVTIPADTTVGPHDIICRAHQHADGSPTDVMYGLPIDVTSSAPSVPPRAVL